jgi:uncharacterized protein (TIGR00290 family)
MPAAVLWSGGKDAMLALDRAVQQGLQVTRLFNLFDDTSGRVRFHGVRHQLIAAQADALGLELLQLATTPDTFEAVFLDGIRQLASAGIDTIIAGNIHLADVRAWYEERTAAAGMVQYEPLWGTPPAVVLSDVVSRGYRARVSCVDTSRGRREWLGRDLDAALAAALAGAGIDAAGESGEYHTFVHDGPLFSRPVAFRDAGSYDDGSYALLDLALP